MMSLHNGIDTVAIATIGTFTKTYGSSAPGNIANLFTSFGLFEDAPDYVAAATRRAGIWLSSVFKLKLSRRR